MVEHVFIGCMLGVQPNPLSDGSEAYQLSIAEIDPVNPGGAPRQMWRYPMSRSLLEEHIRQCQELIDDGPHVELPDLVDIHKVNGHKGELN